MKRKIRMTAFSGAVVLLSFLLLAHTTPGDSVLHAPESSSAPMQQASLSAGLTLFPNLSGAHITSLCVSTPERSFQFHQDQQGLVSVNGRHADSEIYSTLLEQIAELPVEKHSAFTPKAQDLILTLVVSSGAQHRTAHFYSDGHTGENTHIVLSGGELPEYRRTNFWRVGTLMMTCEGTRILDANGNEQPIQ